jgi:hypothetical protein
MDAPTDGVSSRCCLTIRFRSQPDARGRTRMVTCKLVAPERVTAAEVDLFDVLLPLEAASNIDWRNTYDC